MIQRRGLLALAAPAIILTPGLLMPIRPIRGSVVMTADVAPVYALFEEVLGSEAGRETVRKIFMARDGWSLDPRYELPNAA